MLGPISKDLIEKDVHELSALELFNILRQLKKEGKLGEDVTDQQLRDFVFRGEDLFYSPGVIIQPSDNNVSL